MTRRLKLSDSDSDFVAIPCTRTELEYLAELHSYADEINHEELSLELKALGALAELDRRDREQRAKRLAKLRELREASAT